MDIFQENLLFTREFKEALEKKIDEWFGLDIYSIPLVLKKMGIECRKVVVEQCENCNDHISFYIHSQGNRYLISLFRGNMIDPYSHWTVDDGKTERYFDVSVNVEQIV